MSGLLALSASPKCVRAVFVEISKAGHILPAKEPIEPMKERTLRGHSRVIAAALLLVSLQTSGGSGRWGRRVRRLFDFILDHAERVGLRKRDVDRAGRRGLLVAGDQRWSSAF